jgi:hypothetical protein
MNNYASELCSISGYRLSTTNNLADLLTIYSIGIQS